MKQSPSKRPNWEAHSQARRMQLNYYPVTESARTFCVQIAELLSAVDRTRTQKRGEKTRKRFDRACGTFFADLLKAQQKSPKRWSWHEQSPNAFTGERVSYRYFRQIMFAANKLGLIEIDGGFYDRDFFGEKRSQGWGRATRIRPRLKLKRLAGKLGIASENIDQNFQEHLPTKVLVLKAPSVRVGHMKTQGRAMRFIPSSVSARLEREVHEINAFLSNIEISGANHRGFKRVFNEGHNKDYEWNKGGRLYSLGEDNYQLLKKTKRSSITIDGEPISELDIRASHLTILHGLLGVPMVPDKDPYEVNGVPRGVVKGWVTMALGKGAFPKRWSTSQVEELQKEQISVSKEFPLKKITPIILQSMPLLQKWEPKKITSLDLMYAESQAILGTVLELMRCHQIPSLPVHDSLIVQRRQAPLCKKIMVEHYEQLFGVTPVIHEDRPHSIS